MSEVVTISEKKLAPQYKVLLHDECVPSPRKTLLASSASRRRAGPTSCVPHSPSLALSDVNKRDYVVKCLLKCIDGMTTERAYEIMEEADKFGLALVKVEAQEEAEEHCEKLRGNGLISSVEPAD